MSRPPSLAVCVMHAQPLHHGHLAMVELALQRADRVVVVLADAHQARTPATPFTLDERRQVLLDSLEPQQRQRVHTLPLRNWPQKAQREAAIERGVAALLREEGWPTDTRTLLLDCARHAQDPQALRPGGWPCEVLEPAPGLTRINPCERWFSAGPGLTPADWQALQAHVPEASLRAMRELSGTPDFTELVTEWQMLRGYRQAWSAAPYPPVFVTVDAVLRCADQVLLIERAQSPGKGLLALPGGFIDARDSTWQSAVRELREETRLSIDDGELSAACRGMAVFDHPDRSLRGRTITHAFHIDLGQRSLPAIEAADDARDARWVPIGELKDLADRMHDDHFFILDHFLGLVTDER